MYIDHLYGSHHVHVLWTNCAVPEKIHTHPKEGHWKFLGGGGLKSQIFEANL